MKAFDCWPVFRVWMPLNIRNMQIYANYDRIQFGAADMLLARTNGLQFPQPHLIVDSAHWCYIYS